MASLATGGIANTAPKRGVGAASRCPAQDARAARGDRAQPAPGARLRPRPPHAVQAGRALFRRRRHRTHAREKRDPRRPASRAARRSSTPPSARGGMGRGGRRGRSGAPVHRLSFAPQPAAARGARIGARVWKRWQFWLPLALVAAVALAAIAIPLWQKRDYAIALNALAADARDAGGGVGERCAPNSTPRSATTTSRWSGSTRTRARSASSTK